MNNFNRFNCESTSELAKREHCQENSDELAEKVRIWLGEDDPSNPGRKNRIKVIPWGVRTQP